MYPKPETRKKPTSAQKPKGRDKGIPFMMLGSVANACPLKKNGGSWK